MSTSNPAHFTTFFAVPVRDPSNANEFSLEKCFYFDCNWTTVDPKNLQAATGLDIVRIQQRKPVPEKVVGFVETQGYVVNDTVTLFSAVAKTLGGTADMPNNLMAREDDTNGPFVTIPICPGTTRGVILIFVYPASGAPLQLIATSDPEVKSGSSN